MTRLDHTPDVKYRRAWTMAEHDGKVFCSTLPSGKVYSFEAGRSVAWERTFPAGWHHVAAVKAGDRLELFVDGKSTERPRSFDIAQFDLRGNIPLRIGFGENDQFRGRLADIRIYSRALNAEEIRQLAALPGR